MWPREKIIGKWDRVHICYCLMENVNECRTVLIKNLIKESFYGRNLQIKVIWEMAVQYCLIIFGLGHWYSLTICSSTLTTPCTLPLVLSSNLTRLCFHCRWQIHKSQVLLDRPSAWEMWRFLHRNRVFHCHYHSFSILPQIH